MVRIFIGILFIALVSNPMNTICNVKNPIKTVVIDAGHGGKDTGAVGNKSKEKDLALAIALKVGYYLENNTDINVLYTRKDDTFIPLRERANIANNNDADLFVSIHVNSNTKSSPSGTSSHVLGLHRAGENFEVAKRENSVILLEEDYSTTYQDFDPSSPESYIMFSFMQNVYFDKSIEFAQMVQDEFREKAKRKDRGVKQQGLLVLAQTSMPGILIETGFISNPKEEQYLMTSSGQDYIASAIYRAIKKYIAELKKDEATLNALPTSHNDTIKVEPEVIPKKSNDAKISFRIQATSSSSPLGINHPVFSKFRDIMEYKDGNTYKYSIGLYTSYDLAKNHQDEVRKEFPGAFIIAFKGNKKISIQEALSEQ